MDFHTQLKEILKKDGRYKADAYEFVMQAIWHTQKKLKREGHVTGKELLEGIRGFGLAQFGAMAVTVFEHWGVKSTEDFGEVVFNMVENGMLRKTDEDSRKDFKGVYDFNKAFDITDQIKL